MTCGAHAGEVVHLDVIELFRHGHRILGFRVATPQEIEHALRPGPRRRRPHAGHHLRPRPGGRGARRPRAARARRQARPRAAMTERGPATTAIHGAGTRRGARPARPRRWWSSSTFRSGRRGLRRRARDRRAQHHVVRAARQPHQRRASPARWRRSRVPRRRSCTRPAWRRSRARCTSSRRRAAASWRRATSTATRTRCSRASSSARGCTVELVPLRRRSTAGATRSRGPAAVVYVESLSNPLLRVADLPRDRRAGARGRGGLDRRRDLHLAVNVRPLEHGFDLVLHSATKYLNGHTRPRRRRRRPARRTSSSALRRRSEPLGACLDPRVAEPAGARPEDARRAHGPPQRQRAGGRGVAGGAARGRGGLVPAADVASRPRAGPAAAARRLGHGHVHACAAATRRRCACSTGCG